MVYYLIPFPFVPLLSFGIFLPLTYLLGNTTSTYSRRHFSPLGQQIDPKERTNDISSAYTDTLLRQLMVSRPFIAAAWAGAIKCARSLVGSGWLFLLLYAVTPHYHRNWTVRRHRSHCCSSCRCCSWMLRAVLLWTHPHTSTRRHAHMTISA